MVNREISRMKLKERVLSVLLLSICCLFLVKYKLSNMQLNRLQGDDDTAQEGEDLYIGLDGDHSHKKRETFIEDVKMLGNGQKDARKDMDADELAFNGNNNEDVVGNNDLRNKGDKNGSEDKKQDGKTPMDPWDVWWTMVSQRHVTAPDEGEQIERIIQALATRKIVAARAFSRGTQLKVLLELDGPSQQKAVFKPMRYPRDHVITGKIYDGFDRHNAEIAAFHLDRILGFFRAPPVIGRRIDLITEIKPIAEDRLLKTFFKNDNGDECFYGVCYYCKKVEAACASGNIMEGSVTIWLPSEWSLGKMRHPWQRTYNDRKARWELDKEYCHQVMSTMPYNAGPRLLDIMDTAIFDFIIGNGDRHHYETFKKGGQKGMLLHLDNAKSFGNPKEDELSILAPLMQCCRIRKSTNERVTKIAKTDVAADTLSARLRKSLLKDPVSPVLTEPHLQAVDRRLNTVLNIIKNCISVNGYRNVVIDDNL